MSDEWRKSGRYILLGTVRVAFFAPSKPQRERQEMVFCFNYSKCTMPWRIALMAASVRSWTPSFMNKLFN